YACRDRNRHQGHRRDRDHRRHHRGRLGGGALWRRQHACAGCGVAVFADRGASLGRNLAARVLALGDGDCVRQFRQRLRRYGVYCLPHGLHQPSPCGDAIRSACRVAATTRALHRAVHRHDHRSARAAVRIGRRQRSILHRDRINRRTGDLARDLVRGVAAEERGSACGGVNKFLSRPAWRAGAAQGLLFFVSWASPAWKAASVAKVTISETVAPIGAIWIGFESPLSTGPITVAPPAAAKTLVAIEAEWRAGITSTLAASVRRENGYSSRILWLSATSAFISPSYSKLAWPPRSRMVMA